jgi:hypothetical protein
MSKKRSRPTTQDLPTDLDWSVPGRHGLKVHRFLGLALGGGKTDRTCLAMIEYFPKQDKVFLSRLFEKIQTRGDVSGDLELHSLIESSGDVESLAFDVPLTWPKCIRCRLKCPGYETCEQPEILWMWKQQRKKAEEKKTKRLFTPYTERCVELYLQTELEAAFHMSHALGANIAPLTARAHFVLRRLKLSAIEVYPRLSVYRIGKRIGVPKQHLQYQRHSDAGEEARRVFLDKMMTQNMIFIYEQDRKLLIENHQAFDAFICAFTAVCSFRGLCEPRPKDFPKAEGWIAIPKP